MSFQLNATARFGLTGTYKTLLGSGAGQVPHAIKFSRDIVYANGTGEGQADVFWADKARALASGGNDDIDIFDGGTIDLGPGAGRDPLGRDLANAEIVFLYLFNHADSDGNLVIGNAGTNPWTAIVGGTTPTIGPIHPGGAIQLATPAAAAWAVTDASSHQLRVNASGGAVEFDIAILARTA